MPLMFVSLDDLLYIQGFLDFLVLISKQENLAHVILASSEHPFIGFLQARKWC
jgi:hypothetical protein